MAQTTASIVTYHTPLSELDEAIASLVGVDKVWVVDNACHTPTRMRCLQYGPRIIYIGADNNGYGAGHNIALRAALDEGSDYHLVVNADVSFEPAMLSAAIAYMEARPEIGLLHPRLIYPDGGEQYTVRLLPSPIDLIARRFMPRRLFSRRLDRYELRSARGREISAAYVQGSFMLLRAAALRQCGLFDERFFMYPEDIDLSRRIAASGRWQVVYSPRFEASHHHHAASYHSARMLGIHIVNMIRYFNKWGWISDRFRRESNRAVLSQI
ncbi:MAG: glycosyltransferase [Muribaculaceae bacterium]|jgi:GT2 family glycosyltransferase|nr:glycosyltransferase [Muribaculaceae bacterium]